MSQVATVSGRVTRDMSSIGVPNIFVWIDYTNSGNHDDANLFRLTDGNGEYSIESPAALGNMQPVRIVLPPAYVQVTPAGGLGIHAACALGASAAANFVIALNIATPSNP